MDYKKKYYEAQKWIESIYSELSHEQQMEAEAFFPELKESEDERIRKEIIATIHLYYGEPLEDEAKEMIAWLEKQGEQKPAEWHREDEQNLNACFGFIPDEFLRKWLNDIIHVKYDKSSDKVVPKFKVGDWVVYDKYDKEDIDKIVKFDNDKVSFESGDWLYINQLNEDCKLWTIQDAKDGDVLASNRSIFIFSQEYIAGKPEAHCGIMNGLFLVKPEGCWTNEECYPATKEQRDLLFQKMVEHGWEWDSEKNELKKIEQKPTNENPTDVGHEYYSELLNNDDSDTIDEYAYQCAYCMSHDWMKETATWEDVQKAVKLGAEWQKQKSAWSEEDEDYYDAIVAKLEVTQDDAALTDNQMEFLKSLKGRVQLKQEWSEEDEERLSSCIQLLKTSDGFDTINTKWLKSLKERYTWKPSDTQIEALGVATNICLIPEKQYDELNKLYYDLKKLAE